MVPSRPPTTLLDESGQGTYISCVLYLTAGRHAHNCPAIAFPTGAELSTVDSPGACWICAAQLLQTSSRTRTRTRSENTSTSSRISRQQKRRRSCARIRGSHSHPVIHHSLKTSSAVCSYPQLHGGARDATTLMPVRLSFFVSIPQEVNVEHGRGMSRNYRV